MVMLSDGVSFKDYNMALFFPSELLDSVIDPITLNQWEDVKI
jgi:hypothetical protein